jgi:hypothetical protein
MFDQRIVVGAFRGRSTEPELNGAAVFSYTRSGSSVLPRGFAVDSFALGFVPPQRVRVVTQLGDTGSGPHVFTRFITTLDLNLATARFESNTRSANPENASMLGSATIITNV